MLIRKLEDKLNEKNLKPKTQNLKPESGQSLIEVLIAVAIGAILIGAATATIIPVLRSNLETRTVQIAGSLSQEYLDNLRSLAESNWYQVYNPPTAKGPSSQFYLNATSTTFILASGSTSTIAEGRTFTRYFSIENVNRNLCGAGDITTDAASSCAIGPGSSGIIEDPSTQKITSIVSWTAGGSAGGSINKVQYLTRSQNKVFVQSDWSGGTGQEGPITSENNKFATSTNINYSTTTGSIIIQGF
ncbi:MAG: prepilin-type N-terminal cleavage/methylation domain-containing protein [bacterium]|nr:prepilin-type N-terminal cleavage/methylation domain-containing protein [bacterium]